MIQRVDLKRQGHAMKEEIDGAVQEVLSSTQFIPGPNIAQRSLRHQEVFATPLPGEPEKMPASEALAATEQEIRRIGNVINHAI